MGEGGGLAFSRGAVTLTPGSGNEGKLTSWKGKADRAGSLALASTPIPALHTTAGSQKGKHSDACLG